jgi:hypothetical protein
VGVHASTFGRFSGTAARFSYGNTSARATEFTATIRWGDGHSSKGKVVGGQGNFSVIGTHRYGSGRRYRATVTISRATVSARAASEITVIHLSGLPEGCSDAFTLRVQSSGISSLRVLLNGRKLPVHAIHKGKLYSVRVNSGPGTHKLTVSVVFAASSQLGPRTLHETVRGCPHVVTSPSLTG